MQLCAYIVRLSVLAGTIYKFTATVTEILFQSILILWSSTVVDDMNRRDRAGYHPPWHSVLRDFPHCLRMDDDGLISPVGYAAQYDVLSCVVLCCVLCAVCCAVAFLKTSRVVLRKWCSICCGSIQSSHINPFFSKAYPIKLYQWAHYQYSKVFKVLGLENQNVKSIILEPLGYLMGRLVGLDKRPLLSWLKRVSCANFIPIPPIIYFLPTSQ